jgi:hypothetical protein
LATDLGQACLFTLAGEFLYGAVSEFKDSGITGENVRNVKRLRKQAKRHLEKHGEAAGRLRKDKKPRLGEPRGLGGGVPDSGSRSGYEPPVADGRRQTADGRRQTADGRRQTADGRREAGGGPLAAVKRRLRLPAGPD